MRSYDTLFSSATGGVGGRTRVSQRASAVALCYLRILRVMAPPRRDGVTSSLLGSFDFPDSAPGCGLFTRFGLPARQHELVGVSSAVPLFGP